MPWTWSAAARWFPRITGERGAGPVTISRPSAPTLLALGGLLALAAAMGVGRFMYTPLLPHMEQGLGLSKSAAGLLASVNYLGYMIGALLAASPLVPGSRRRWMLAGLAASAATTAAMGWAQGMAALLALRLLGGVASALVLVFCSALVVQRLTLSGRPGLTALHFAGVGSGIAASSLLVAWLAAGGADWRAMWLGGGLLAATALVLVAAMVREDAGAPSPGGGSARERPALLRALVLSYGLFGFGYVITATFIVSMVRSLEAVRELEPYIWLLVGLAAAPSVWLWSRIARRVGVVPAYAWAFVVESIGVAISVLWQSPVGLVLAAVFLGGTIMAITALGLVAAGDLSRRDPRRTMAVMTAAFGFGQIVGPLFAGLVADRTGSLVMPSLLASLTLLAGAVIVARALRRHRSSGGD